MPGLNHRYSLIKVLGTLMVLNIYEFKEYILPQNIIHVYLIHVGGYEIRDLMNIINCVTCTIRLSTIYIKINIIKDNNITKK